MNKPPVNPFHLNERVLRTLAQAPDPVLQISASPGVDPSALVVDGVLTQAELNLVCEDIDSQAWIPVGTDGILDNYQDGDPVGSYRASCMSLALADVLWKRLSPVLGGPRVMDETTKTDWRPHRVWEPIGLNPLFRFINYKRSGLLIPHYDAPYDDPDSDQRTLVTVVLYLRSDPGISGGQTRFIADPQDQLEFTERDFSDWDNPAHPEQVIAEVDPSPGRALVFDHRLLHDSSALSGSGQKTILRTDVIYQPVGEQ